VEIDDARRRNGHRALGTDMETYRRWAGGKAMRGTILDQRQAIAALAFPTCIASHRGADA